MDDQIAKRGRLHANTPPNLKEVLAGNRFLTDDRHFPAQNRPNRAARDEMAHRRSIHAAYRAKPRALRVPVRDSRESDNASS
jgi:phosphate-selective porin